MSHDVFISYSSIDKKIADAIKHGLHAVGIRCWMAPDDLSAGTDWASELTQAIESSKVMVLVWTSASMASAEVPKELGLAMTSRVVVIPFRLENIQPEGSFKYHLSGRHWLDVYDKELEEAIGHLTRLTSSIVEPGGDSSASTSRIHFFTQAEAPDQEKTEQQPTPLGKEAGERDDQVEQGSCLDSSLTNARRHNSADSFSKSNNSGSTSDSEDLQASTLEAACYVSENEAEIDREFGKEVLLSPNIGTTADELKLVSEMASFRDELALLKDLLKSNPPHEQELTEEEEILIDHMTGEGFLDDIHTDDINTLWALGRLAELEDMAHQLLDMRTKYLGPDAYRIAPLANSLSRILAKKKDFDGALVYAMQALKNRAEGFEGSEGFFANQDRLWIAAILNIRGKMTDARVLLKEIDKDYAKHPGHLKGMWDDLLKDVNELRSSMEATDGDTE
jgi:hypothetical protein